DDAPPSTRVVDPVAGNRDRVAPVAAPAPPVDVLCKAAVELALADPERARGFVSRARLAGWLPEVGFRAYRRFARTEGLSFADTGGGTVEPVDISSIDDVRYEWRASWDLSRMVFNPDELQAHFEALRMSDARREIQSLVIRLYFERRRLLWETPGGAANAANGTEATPGATAEAAGTERRLSRIAEIEAQLDALSNGAFSAAPTVPREASHAP
ncbi:MAG: hypothetical protein ABUS79_17105, partial [Pseudomonadota bacterium]